VANLYLGSLNGAFSLRNLLAFDGFDIQLATEMTSSEIQMAAGDGSVLSLIGNFSSPEQSEWEIFSLSHTQNDASLVSISDVSFSIAQFEALSGKELTRMLLAGNDEVSSGLDEDLIVRTYSGDDLVALGDGNNTVYAGRGSDTLQGGDGQDMLIAGKGADRLKGAGGDDFLNGGMGRDRIWGGSSNDSLFGKSGRDKLFGGTGNDTLIGGKGNDRLIGGQDDDTLTGGQGADIFIFRENDHSDVVTDFEIGIDRIKILSGASGMNEVDFVQEGGDVMVYFGNVSITVENTTVSMMDDGDNFLF